MCAASGKAVNSFTNKGSGRNEKLLPSGISTVGIVWKVPSTTNTTIHKNHHHGWAVRPFYGVGSMDPPDLMQDTSSEGVGQERLGVFFYKNIK